MKTLVAYFSRTGTTKKIAVTISSMLESDIEEIIDTKKRAGPIGLLVAVKDAKQKKLTRIEEMKNDPADYDIVIIGTPIWTGTISTPIRTYITQTKESLGKVALFCTSGSTRVQNTLTQMEELCGKTPVAVLSVQQKEVEANNFEEDVKKFVEEIKASS